MGTLDQFRTAFGDDFFSPRAREAVSSVHEVCVCGHLDRYHSPDIGGAYRVPEPEVQKSGTTTTVFHGCVGAMKARNFEPFTLATNREERTVLKTIHATCPCEELRAVASVDRPNRFFNQRMPTDRSDSSRHPFQIGVRAFTTHLGKRKAVLKDPTWADREFEKRFTWLTETRVCSISTCRRAGEDVFPAFVNGDGLSELRCSSHR